MSRPISAPAADGSPEEVNVGTAPCGPPNRRSRFHVLVQQPAEVVDVTSLGFDLRLTAN